MKRKTLLTLCLLAVAMLGTWAQGPNGSGRYYRPANGKSGAELKTALCQIICDPKVVGYGGYVGLKEAYRLTDVRPDGYLRDWYSNATQYEPGSNFSSSTKEEGQGYNREHLLPQSWFGSKVDPMYSDIMHVVPTDARLNGMRSDNPFGEVTDKASQVSKSKNGYSQWGAPNKDLGAPSGLSKVFEPNDEIKGDIARIYFYMLTAYEDRLMSWPWRNSRTATYVFDEAGSPYEPLKPWAFEMFMRWSAQDPVDSIELARNEGVWRVQGNRNPYVDYPGLEQYVWGELRDQPFTYGDESGYTEAPFTPTVTIALNSKFFGGEWTGVRPAASSCTLRGEKGGITVEYALGNEGSNMYLGNDHIRLYQKNLLVVTATDATMQDITFKVKRNDAKKVLMVGDEVLDGYHWTGDASKVTFHLDDGNGVFYLESITIKRTKIQQEIKGDVNGDGIVDVADIATIIYVMADGSGIANPLQQAADVNGDGNVDVADIATVIDIMATGK
ncbi:MAG: endonuclease [Prevotella sp.]|nr:endonuclease [Prevotella sp.]MBR3481195.1 endonuclease [Prevotella sp.]